MKIIVTGGSGFIGTNLIQRLINDKIDVLNIDKNPPRNVSHTLVWLKGDICNFEFLEKTFSEFQPEIVIHLAARTDLDGRSLTDYSANVEGLNNLIECCNLSKTTKRVLFTSSMLVCRLGYQPKNDEDYCPATIYGESKVLGERLVREKIRSDLDWVLLRPTSLWGPWFDVPYRSFFDAVRSGMFIMPRKYEVWRSYGFILNSIEQILALIYTNDNKAMYRVHYLADYQPIELYEWSKEIIRVSKKGRVYKAPFIFLKSLALFGDLLQILGFKSPPLTSFRLNNMLTNAIYNLDSWHNLCNEQKYNMKEGVALTVDWLENVNSRSE